MSKKIRTSPIHQAYWCRTSVIDEIVCQRKGIEFNKELAAELEEKARHYFIVNKDGGYKVVSGPEFEKHFNDQKTPMTEWKSAPNQELNPIGEKAMNAYIRSVHGV